MKKLLLIGIIPITLLSNSLTKQYEKEFLNLDPYQIEMAKFIFNHAKKDELSWSAAAIAWQESQFGRWQINVNSPNSWDCGVFQNNTKSVARHNDIDYNRYNKKEICTDLITSFSYSYLSFAQEIKYWENVHNGNWNKIWSSYNGGWKGNKTYSKMIASRIQVLKRHLKGIK